VRADHESIVGIDLAKDGDETVIQVAIVKDGKICHGIIRRPGALGADMEITKEAWEKSIQEFVAKKRPSLKAQKEAREAIQGFSAKVRAATEELRKHPERQAKKPMVTMEQFKQMIKEGKLKMPDWLKDRM